VGAATQDLLIYFWTGKNIVGMKKGVMGFQQVPDGLIRPHSVALEKRLFCIWGWQLDISEQNSGSVSAERTENVDASIRQTTRWMMNVLIVEQNELLAVVLADALADEGIEAAVMRDDAAALAACEPDMPQVVVTGINRRRDDMRGLRFGRAIRNRCPLLAVIYMAAIWPAQLTLCTHERFLAKPLAMGTLIQTVRELMPE
jgi:CheY-like chemotaxis protein